MSDPNTPPPAAPLNYASALPPGYVESDPNQRTLGMIAHLLGIIGFLGPLILYLVKNNDASAGPFAKDQIKESLNWQLTLMIGFVIGVILAIIIIGVFINLGLMICNIIFVILNCIKANKGEVARYPWSIKFIK